MSVRPLSFIVTVSLLGVSGAPGRTSGISRQFDLEPRFYADIRCGENGWGVWSPSIRGCFNPDEVWIQSQGVRVEMRFRGARSVRPTALEPDGARINVLRGEAGSWSSTQGTRVIRYPNLYRGIDLVYRIENGHLKSEFHVYPGHSADTIRIQYSRMPRIDADGSLAIETENGVFREQAPVAYYRNDSTGAPIDAAFILDPDGAVGFMTGQYDTSRTMVIDPLLKFSTMFGGYGQTTINSVAVDTARNLYFAGCTDASVSNITGAYQRTYKGGNEAFVGKLGTDGKLVYATYLGGSGNDCATGIATDSGGNVVVTGWTSSRDFPAVSAFQAALRGGRDAFVAKLGPQGNTLLFSTYLGGLGADQANGVALDGSGNIYVGGQTQSSDFPVRNPFQPHSGGGTDAFLAELAPGGQLVFSTYYGGARDDSAAAVAVSADGAAVIAGATFSSDLRTALPVQMQNAGGQDAFVAAFAKGGTSLRYATYLGGSAGSIGAPEYATSIALDGNGAAYITGVTSSSNFPVKNAIISALRGGTDAFVTKIQASGVQLAYSTYLGGASVELSNAVAVDGAGNAYVAGATWSPDFPVNGLLTPRKYDYDAFVTELDPNGASLLFSSFLAASGADSATTLAVDSAGVVYVGGQTFSLDFPLLNSLAQPTGASQGFLVEMTNESTPKPVSVSPSSGSGYRQQFSVISSNAAGASHLVRTYIMFRGSSSTMCYLVYNAPNGLYLLNDSATDFVRPIVLGTADSMENSQCRVYAATSSVTNSGTNQTLVVDFSFKPAFAGPKDVVLQSEAEGARYSPPTILGFWTVTASPNEVPLRPVSVAPSSGSGYSQQFVFTSTDPVGASHLLHTYVQFSAATSSNMCYIVFAAPAGIYLLNDDRTAFLNGIVPGANSSVENSQCRIDGSHSAVVNSGDTQTLTLGIYFKPAFAGTKDVLSLVETLSNQYSATYRLGTWTVTMDASAATLAPVSVTPSSGSGSTQQFVFTLMDPAGAPDIVRSYLVFDSPTSSAACYVVYASGGLYLLNDPMTAFLNGIVPGTNTSVENSQCRLSAVNSSVTNSGVTQTIKLDLFFKPAFAGPKNVSALVETYANQYSSRRLLGSWIVP